MGARTRPLQARQRSRLRLRPVPARELAAEGHRGGSAVNHAADTRRRRSMPPPGTGGEQGAVCLEAQRPRARIPGLQRAWHRPDLARDSGRFPGAGTRETAVLWIQEAIIPQCGAQCRLTGREASSGQSHVLTQRSGPLPGPAEDLEQVRPGPGKALWRPGTRQSGHLGTLVTK